MITFFVSKFLSLERRLSGCVEGSSLSPREERQVHKECKDCSISDLSVELLPTSSMLYISRIRLLRSFEENVHIYIDRLQEDLDSPTNVSCLE